MQIDQRANRACLLSLNALDRQSYDGNASNNHAKTWSGMELATWLETDFFNAAFTQEQQEHVLVSTVDGVSVHVTIPSLDDYDHYKKISGVATCSATDYAVAHGAYVNDKNNRTSWWLRYPDGKQPSEAEPRLPFVGTADEGRTFGYGSSSGGNTFANSDNSVRPMIWVELDWLQAGHQ